MTRLAPALLDPTIAERLAKLCGRFGSDFDNERAIAARKADKLVRANGLTWDQIIGAAVQPSKAELEWPDSDWTAVDAALSASDLTEWEFGFLSSIRSILGRGGRLSAKQRATVQSIFAQRCAA